MDLHTTAKQMITKNTTQKLLKVLLWLLIILVSLLILFVMTVVLLLLFFRDQLYTMLLEAITFVFGDSPDSVVRTILKKTMDMYLKEYITIPFE